MGLWSIFRDNHIKTSTGKLQRPQKPLIPVLIQCNYCNMYMGGGILYTGTYRYGLVQDCGISSVSAMEIPQFCTNPHSSVLDCALAMH